MVPGEEGAVEPKPRKPALDLWFEKYVTFFRPLVRVNHFRTGGMYKFEEGLSQVASLAVRAVITRPSRGAPPLFLFLEHGCQALGPGQGTAV